ncbi:hypothetical protein [Roseibium album]|uniref:hypothetical protein n=1 Tax=Roseibium album TaxID=311410 RepID=UPI002491DAD2|nr:hypothetical protein [Roseibium album]
MPDPKIKVFENRFTTGNAITILIMLATVTAGWTRMEAALADHERRILEAEQEVKEIVRDQRGFEQSFAGLRSDMKHVIAEVSRTRQTVERLDRERKQ